MPEGWPRDGAPFTFVSDGIERAVELEGPLSVVQGIDVTHLRYRVRR